MAVEHPTTKVCSKCKAEKPLDMFTRHVKGKYGRAADCKECKRKHDAEYREINRDRVLHGKREYYARNKEAIIEKQRSYFENNKDKVREIRRSSSAKWRIANTEEARKRSRECQQKARERDREKYRARDRKYRAENPERIRIKCANRRAKKKSSGGVLSKNIKSRLLKIQKGRCACCGKPLGDNYHLDHIVPLALGGSNTDQNIQLLRAECNIQKGAKHPVDFMQQKGFLL